jgi:uncharacterized surface protein with fasciclin (FAS1) repeats
MKRTITIACTVGALALTTAACGGGSTASTATSAAPAASAAASPDAGMSSAAEASPSAMASESAMASDGAAAASGPVGPGCADYAKMVPSGAGSVAGMAADPVATAASNNPLLTTLVAAVSGKLNPKVNLVDTLNGGKFTVFAPVDSAFKALPAATVAGLKTDAPTLTKILTYHVVPGELTPSQVVGMQKTVEGGSVTVAGTPDALTVNGAKVLCGGVQTSNATVYLIDKVLTPTK